MDKFAPTTDRTGKLLLPGDKVSFKLYPRGAARGIVVISQRAQQRHEGVWLPALAIVSDGTIYSLVSCGTRKLSKQG